MPFYADLHVHSKYSRACSRDCDLEHLAWWAGRKGLSVVGTGDFTHPAWFEHLQDTLVPAEAGLFKLRPDLAKSVARRLPASCWGPVRFMLSVEIATIYKRAGQTRKVHHLIYVPNFAAARSLTGELAKVGNLASDGRPILGLDSRDLLEMTLASDPDAYLVPAHIWTPWFSALGSKSGFDTVADCYGDLADHICAVETGLSSDPPMNYRLAALDQYRLVSNSDAHSPPMLAREATAFDTELNYFAIRDALQTGNGGVETVEFFPEEGKYHLDGHRKCGLRLHPAQTREHANRRCPECGKPVTVGVLHRVEELADRPEGYRRPHADAFNNLVPLPEILAEVRGVGSRTKTVQAASAGVTAELGPELSVLRETSLDEIARADTPELAEAIGRLRQGKVVREAGFDGEYGVIRLFQPGELGRRASEPALFDLAEPGVAPASSNRADTAPDRVHTRPAPADRDTSPPSSDSPLPSGENRDGADEASTAPPPAAAETVTGTVGGTVGETIAGTVAVEPPLDGSLLNGLDPDQRVAASVTDGPVLVVAGPGTGKTRTLTYRIAYLVSEWGVTPERCLALTFTRRACAEMRERLSVLAGPYASRVTVSTFHGLGAMILRENPGPAGLAADFGIADETERRAIAEDLAGSPREAGQLLADVDADRPADSAARSRFTKALRERNLVDFDDLIGLPVQLLSQNPDLAAHYRQRWAWISVDEYQDVDEQQYYLLRLLSRPDSSVYAIGDPDQAIYGFRGADVGYFLRFQQDYPPARRIQLTRNYRSSPPIIDGAIQAIRPASLVPDRTLRPARGDPAASGIGMHVAHDEYAEARAVVTAIDRVLGGSSFHSLDSGRVDADGAEGISFADIAVLCRTEAAARPVSEALTGAGMPFQKRSHDRLASRPGVQEIVRQLRHQARLDLRSAAAAAIGALPPSATAEDAAHIRSAHQLLHPLAERSEGDLQSFLGELALGAEVDTWDPRADRISVLTVHAAKGLEFAVVFLVGCEDGLLPLRWPGDVAGTDMGEERRLFFVAMTRARSRIVLSRARSRTWQGRTREADPSPFLAAIGTDLLEPTGEESSRRRRDHQLRLL